MIFVVILDMFVGDGVLGEALRSRRCEVGVAEGRGLPGPSTGSGRAGFVFAGRAADCGVGLALRSAVYCLVLRRAQDERGLCLRGGVAEGCGLPGPSTDSGRTGFVFARRRCGLRGGAGVAECCVLVQVVNMTRSP